MSRLRTGSAGLRRRLAPLAVISSSEKRGAGLEGVAPLLSAGRPLRSSRKRTLRPGSALRPRLSARASGDSEGTAHPPAANPRDVCPQRFPPSTARPAGYRLESGAGPLNVKAVRSRWPPDTLAEPGKHGGRGQGALPAPRPLGACEHPRALASRPSVSESSRLPGSGLPSPCPLRLTTLAQQL